MSFDLATAILAFVSVMIFFTVKVPGVEDADKGVGMLLSGIAIGTFLVAFMALRP